MRKSMKKGGKVKG